MFYIAAAIALLLGALAAVKLALEPATALKIGVFQPWRRDPWPIGVQEDDDARFNWAAPPTSVAVGEPGPAGVVGRLVERATAAASLPTPAPDPVEPGQGTIEDGTDGPVEVQRLRRVSVRHPRS